MVKCPVGEDDFILLRRQFSLSGVQMDMRTQSPRSFLLSSSSHSTFFRPFPPTLEQTHPTRLSASMRDYNEFRPLPFPGLDFAMGSAPCQRLFTCASSAYLRSRTSTSVILRGSNAANAGILTLETRPSLVGFAQRISRISDPLLPGLWTWCSLLLDIRPRSKMCGLGCLISDLYVYSTV